MWQLKTCHLGHSPRRHASTAWQTMCVMTAGCRQCRLLLSRYCNSSARSDLDVPAAATFLEGEPQCSGCWARLPGLPIQQSTSASQQFPLGWPGASSLLPQHAAPCLSDVLHQGSCGASHPCLCGVLLMPRIMSYSGPGPQAATALSSSYMKSPALSAMRLTLIWHGRRCLPQRMVCTMLDCCHATCVQLTHHCHTHRTLSCKSCTSRLAHK